MASQDYVELALLAMFLIGFFVGYVTRVIRGPS